MVPLVLIVLSAIPLIAGGNTPATDPFTGQWKVDETKAKPSTGLQARFLRIEASQEKVSITFQGTDEKGAGIEWKVMASVGGTESGVIGWPEVDAVKCWRPDPRTILMRTSRQAQSVGWDTAEVSKNGKSLRLTHVVEDGNGKEIKSVTWFEKQ